MNENMNNSRVMIYLILSLVILLAKGTFPVLGQNGANAFSGVPPCHVMPFEEDGTILLNILESIGSSTDQLTEPPELPVSGEPGTEIELKIVSAEDDVSRDRSDEIFYLEGKTLKLRRPLDRDKNDLSSLIFQVTCTVLTTGRRKTIPVVVTISDINDNAPKFIGTPYQVTVPESTPVGSVIFNKLSAIDPDANVNGQIEYRILDDEGELEYDEDGVVEAPYFKIDLPHQGLITVARPLDYEAQKMHVIKIIASDRAVDLSKRFTATTTLIVNVMDSDDLDPEFAYEQYTAKVTSGLKVTAAGGALEVRPEKIRAEDKDTLRTEVRYSFLVDPNHSESRNFATYFSINPQTGIVSQIKPVMREDNPSFNLLVKAEEKSKSRRSATAMLTIMVLPEDKSPPILHVSNKNGYVDENSPEGTKVVDGEGNNITFKITDADHDGNTGMDGYTLEITTNFFRIDMKTGALLVNEPNLDRDPPSSDRLTFQVFAREAKESDGDGKTSRPVSITVIIRDVNDNSPVLETIEDVIITAGKERRKIAKISATDNDSDKRVEYELVDITGSSGASLLSRPKFFVHRRNGQVDVIEQVRSGEYFSLTLAAKDSGGRNSTAIMQVRVAPGPNLKGPVFNQFVYEVTIREDAPKFSKLVTVKAIDPENAGSVSFAISGGDDDELFQMEETTGTIRVMKHLDREARPKHILLVKATDVGGMSSTATVNIKVTDINDEAPVFSEASAFRVKEGVMGLKVGKVEAIDSDADKNAEVTYQVLNDPFFSIDENLGEIRTRTALDFETQNVHYLTVIARDKGETNQKSSSATFTVFVQDEQDEVPTFPTRLYTGTISENTENAYVTTVQAEDLDSEKSITYRLVSGDVDKFAINPATGEIRTKNRVGGATGIDYERSQTHKLIIGTEEGRGSFLKSRSGVRRSLDFSDDYTVCQVDITVTDVNDVSPNFIRAPLGNTITIGNDARIGQKIGFISAQDNDGTSPNNEVRYSLSVDQSSERATTYFSINDITGEIEVLGDLKRELFENYLLSVVATDRGEPPISASMTIVIQVQQVVTVAPGTGIGFDKVSHKIQLKEQATVDGDDILLYTLNLDREKLEYSNEIGRNAFDTLNKVNVDCSIDSVTDDKNYPVRGLFKARISEEDKNACNIFLANHYVIKDKDYGNIGLDYEKSKSYKISVGLRTLSAFVNPQKANAIVTVNVIDVNDNIPRFVYDHGSFNDQYLLTLSDSVVAGANIFHVSANDSDSGEFGKIRYELAPSNDDKVSDLFMIDGTSGKIFTLEGMKQLDQRFELPLKIDIIARDNPDGGTAAQNFAVTHLLLNIIRPQDGVVLVISNSPPDVIEKQKDKLTKLLRSQTGLLVEIDRLEISETKYESRLSNSTVVEVCCRQNPNSTDVYLHFENPKTNEILAYDDPVLSRHVTSESSANNIKYSVSGDLGVQASDIHPPYEEILEKMALQDVKSSGVNGRDSDVTQAGVAGNFDGLPAVLIALGALVFAVAIAAILYLCFIRRRYSHTVEKSSTPRTIIVPRYEPVYVSGNNYLKEYETQVLQMSVPPTESDNDSLNKAKNGGVSSSSSHRYIARYPSFNLDSISYITKDRTNESMSTVNTSSFHSLAEEGNFNSNIGASGHPSGSSIVSNGRIPEESSHVGDTTNFYSVLAERPETTDDESELVVATSTPIRRRDIINANDEDDFNNRSPIKSMTQL